MNGGAHCLLSEQLFVEPPNIHMSRSNPLEYFGKSSLGVRVPSKQAHRVELIPMFVAQNGEK